MIATKPPTNDNILITTITILLSLLVAAVITATVVFVIVISYRKCIKKKSYNIESNHIQIATANPVYISDSTSNKCVTGRHTFVYIHVV
jgi:hypothetical protein